jgi:hypothetical protein
MHPHVYAPLPQRRRLSWLVSLVTLPLARVFFLTVTSLLIVPGMTTAVQAVTVTKTNSTDGRADRNTIPRTVTFGTSDFASGSTINTVTVVLQFAHIDDTGSDTNPTCGPPPVNGTSSERNDELFFRLSSPGGTTINLISPATYQAFGFGGQVTVTLDDTATATLSGIPATGTFRPSAPLSTFSGENPLGDWTVTVGDTGGGDPLCFYEARLTITATVPPQVCGNGVVEGTEQCDGGACCSNDCTFASAGTTCGGSAAACDALDTCNGSGGCVDRIDPVGTVCASANGICDPADTCDGVNRTCPVTVASAGTACGGSNAECDALDTCNGSGGCVDNVDSAGTVCRPGVDGCDVAETCTGSSTSCPVDVGAAATTGCTVNGIPNQPCQGGAGDDLILGTSSNDVIRGGLGADTLKGNAGDDLLCGDEGDDTLLGATGNDTLIGGQGSDVLKGEAGNDTLDGGTEDDTLIGGAGLDHLDGGPGNDKLIGNEDADVLLGDTGNDILNGGDGNDVLDGEADVDDLTGGAGTDICLNGEKLTTCE